MDRNAEDWLNAGTLSVALRKESVDRNTNFFLERLFDLSGSLSARRAWIEITGGWKVTGFFTSRSPQGERG